MIFWGSLKNPTFREDSRKTNIDRELLKKGGLEGEGALGKKEGVTLLRRLIPQYTL